MIAKVMGEVMVMVMAMVMGVMVMMMVLVVAVMVVIAGDESDGGVGDSDDGHEDRVGPDLFCHGVT